MSLLVQIHCKGMLFSGQMTYFILNCFCPNYWQKRTPDNTKTHQTRKYHQHLAQKWKG